ncbi:36350_t:CDS:2, partial [Gigaspora margarita]
MRMDTPAPEKNNTTSRIIDCLRIQNKNTVESIIINDKLQWKVSVSPGTYMFAINDGTDDNFLGIPVGGDNVGGANVGKGRSANQVNNDKGMINENSESVGQKSSYTSSQDIPKSQVPMSPASINSVTP